MDLLTEDKKTIIFEKLKNTKENVEINFSFLNLSSEEKEKLFQNALNEALENETKSSLELLLKKLQKCYTYELNEALKLALENDLTRQVLKDYTVNFIKKSSKKNVEQLLLKYSKNLFALLPNISFEDCNFILQNTEINDLISKLVHPKNNLDKAKIASLMQTNLFLLLDLYCKNNDITIETNEGSYAEYYLFDENQYHSSEYYNENEVFTDDHLNDYLKSLPEKILTLDEQHYYFKLISEGDASAKEYVIMHNLRLVVSIAKGYSQTTSLSLLDLIQEGNTGLIKAVERFDINMGYKFSTYATWWINQAISRAISEIGRNIRIPVHAYTNVNKYNRAKMKLSNRLGREATDLEIAKEMKISMARLETIIKATHDTVSYNIDVSNIDDKEETQLIDIVADESIDIENSYIKNDLRNLMNDALCSLTDKEKLIIVHRFGLNGESAKSLDTVGKMLNITRERVRQIQKKALKKLYNNTIARNAVNYLDKPIDFKKKKEEVILFSYFGSTRKYVLEAIDYLEQEEKEYLQSLYGEDFDKKSEINTTEEHERIIRKIKLMTKAFIKPKTVVEITSNLCSLLNLASLEELESLIDNLNTFDKKLVYEKYQNNLMQDATHKLPLPLENYFTNGVLKELIRIKKELEDKNKTFKKKHHY